MASHIGRRKFLATLGGAAVWPLAAQAQQAGKLPTIGFLVSGTPSSHGQWVAAFVRRLHELGWIEGRTVAIEYRWAEGRTERAAEIAAEFVRRKVDVIVTSATTVVVAAKQATSVIPIVFMAGDPVGTGLVASLARPGGNATGFMSFEYTLSGKWLGLLKDIAPGVTRVAVLQDPTQGGGSSAFAVIQAAASSLGVEITPVNLRDAPEIERALADFARTSNGGLIVTGSALSNVHHKLIITLAARHKLPAIYLERSFAADGGLISYGSDYIDHY